MAGTSKEVSYFKLLKIASEEKNSMSHMISGNLLIDFVFLDIYL